MAARRDIVAALVRAGPLGMTQVEAKSLAHAGTQCLPAVSEELGEFLKVYDLISGKAPLQNVAAYLTTPMETCVAWSDGCVPRGLIYTAFARHGPRVSCDSIFADVVCALKPCAAPSTVGRKADTYTPPSSDDGVTALESREASGAAASAPLTLVSRGASGAAASAPLTLVYTGNNDANGPNDAMPAKVMCFVCARVPRSADAVCAVIPCGHKCVCTDHKKVDKCPYCGMKSIGGMEVLEVSDAAARQ